jgi:homeobox protein cut-like
LTMIQEAQRAIQALNPLERATFALTRAIIGNKRARSAFIMYTASLVSYRDVW